MPISYPYLKSEGMQTFTLLAIIVCFANVFYFMNSSAIPIIQADAWYFLDVDVIKWAQGGFHWQDLFVKRGLVDHAQPLNKFFLYVNYRFFDLDFRFESFLGFFGLASIAIFFCLQFIRHVQQNNSDPVCGLVFLMAIFTLASLNATGLYSWTLVTFSFLPLFIAILTSWSMWKIITQNRLLIALPFSFIAFVIVGDTAAIILWFSISITVVLLKLRSDRVLFRKALIWLLVSGIYVGGYFLLLNFKFLFSESNSASGKSLDLLDIHFYIESIRIIFSSTLVQAQHLEVFGTNAKSVSWIIAIPVFYFYVQHFLQLLFFNRPVRDVDFLITFILTYATISIAAIIFGRVPEFGVEYLNQPRYVLVYQLIPFALLLKWAFSAKTNIKFIPQHFMYGIILISFAAFTLLQLGYSAKAHKSTRWISQWVSNQVVAISSYASDPAIPAGNCTAHSKPICNLPVSKRNELLSFLITHQLNLFNPDFQWKYRVFPVVKIEKYSLIGWGPQELKVNSTTQGIWIKFFQPIQEKNSEIKITLGGIEIERIYISGNVVTFDVPPAIKIAPGEHILSFRMLGDGKETMIGKLTISN
jgi:hypothetical protein